MDAKKISVKFLNNIAKNGHPTFLVRQSYALTGPVKFTLHLMLCVAQH
jgi:hypothetical protein